MFAAMQASVAILACSISALVVVIIIDSVRRWRK